jgi:hypothetical protein
MAVEPMGCAVLRKVGGTLVWVIAGLLGSAVIYAAWLFVIEAQIPLRIRHGGQIYTGHWEEGYVSAHGTWVIENGRQAFPNQITELTCLRSERLCRSATAIAGDTLSVDTETYEVLHWTDDTVVLTTSSALCVDYTYTISRAEERVVGRRTPKRNVDSMCDVGTKDILELSLGDGSKVTLALQQEARVRTRPFMVAGLAVVWVFIASRLLRRRSRGSVVAGAPA